MSSDSSQQPDRRQELALERTDIAHRRTRLAEERTYSAWIRTGLAAMATGVAIAKLMTDAGPTWMVRSLALLFVAVGGSAFGLAFWAYRRALRHTPEPAKAGIPLWAIATLTIALIVGAGLGMAFIFIE